MVDATVKSGPSGLPATVNRRARMSVLPAAFRSVQTATRRVLDEAVSTSVALPENRALIWNSAGVTAGATMTGNVVENRQRDSRVSWSMRIVPECEIPGRDMRDA